MPHIGFGFSYLLAAYCCMTQAYPAVHRLTFSHPKFAFRRCLSSEYSTSYITRPSPSQGQAAYFHILATGVRSVKAVQITALRCPALPFYSILAFRKSLQPVNPPLNISSHSSAARMGSNHDGTVSLIHDVTIPYTDDLEDYHFPITRLKQSLEDPTKTPLVLVACGSFSPYV